MSHSQYKRRTKLPRPRLQLRMIGAFAGLCALALLAQTLLLGALMMELANSLPTGGPRLAEELPGALMRALGLSVLMILPALGVIGVRITFKLAGPLYRFEQHLGAIAAGEWPDACRIRKGDDLQEFCTLLNDALSAAHARGVADAGARLERDAA